MSILQVYNSLPVGWEPYFNSIRPNLEYIQQQYLNNIYMLPPAQDVFNAFHLCPFPPKVVIIGQDPYHTVINGVPQATGLAFSTRPGISMQPSVKNIMNEVISDYPEYSMPNHGDLTHWAKQGVLLLNTSLTVVEGRPNIHQGIWRGVVKMLLDYLRDYHNIIYVLWGADAHKLKDTISAKATKMMASHPSPMSVNRAGRDIVAFKGCGHFKKINELLTERDQTTIQWLETK
jgi:uracil-DNA glycosylase